MKNFIKRYYAIMFKYKHFEHFNYLQNLIKTKDFFKKLLCIRNSMLNDLNFLETIFFTEQEFNSYLTELTWLLDENIMSKKRK